MRATLLERSVLLLTISLTSTEITVSILGAEAADLTVDGGVRQERLAACRLSSAIVIIRPAPGVSRLAPWSWHQIYVKMLKSPCYYRCMPRDPVILLGLRHESRARVRDAISLCIYISKRLHPAIGLLIYSCSIPYIVYVAVTV